ncbi:hypothetical protein, partial [uncultured Nitrospira sp.]|uniref:hypothetical protein n=1 Tax=uncultured Nitrospira sp. TaxID=157176 RepID=UPI0031406F99
CHGLNHKFYKQARPFNDRFSSKNLGSTTICSFQFLVHPAIVPKVTPTKNAQAEYSRSSSISINMLGGFQKCPGAVGGYSFTEEKEGFPFSMNSFLPNLKPFGSHCRPDASVSLREGSKMLKLAFRDFIAYL